MKPHHTATLALLLGSCWLLSAVSCYQANNEQALLKLGADQFQSFPPLAQTKKEGTLRDENQAHNKLNGQVKAKSERNRHLSVSQQLDNEIASETKTYERVVLEGSKISISCPHSAIKFAPMNTPTIPKRTQQATVKVVYEGASNEQKQFRLLEDENGVGAEDDEDKQWQAVPRLNTERVKWFRNHVLLQDSNHRSFPKRQPNRSQHHKQNHHFSRTHSKQPGHHNRLQKQYRHSAARHNSIYGQLLASQVHGVPTVQSTIGTTATNMTGLNRTTKLSQTETVSSEPELQTRDSLTIFSSTRQSGLPAENVNELTGNRKWSNTVQASSVLGNGFEGGYSGGSEEERQWYINEFGELVINKATQYFAGKYTCQLGGRQSEVLLDVLMDSLPDKNSEQAFTMGDVRFEHANSDVKTEASIPSERFLSSKSGVGFYSTSESLENAVTSSAGSPPSNYDVHHPGNRPLERNWPIIDSKGRAEQDQKSSMESSVNDYKGASKVENTVSLDLQLLDKDSSSLRFDSTKTLQADLGEKLSPDDAKLIYPRGAIAKLINDESLPDKDAKDDDESQEGTSSLTSVGSSLRKTSNATKSLFMQKYRHSPIHLVKTEIIQANDLKLVPGFLYTKHQLLCPVTSKQAQKEHMNSFTRAICTTSLKRSILADNKMDELKCHRLVGRLLAQISRTNFTEPEEDRGSRKETKLSDCSEPLLEVEWFKNGEWLDFDTNGRAKDISLNLKLIDFFEQFSMTSDSIGKDRDTTDTGSEGKEDSTKASLRSKKIREASRATLETKPSIQANSHRQIKWMCPLRGRILEIDGVRKENAGRYTCALRLNISKLDGIIQNLQRLDEVRWKTNWNVATSHDNDISFGDEPKPIGGPLTGGLQDERQSPPDSADQIEIRQTIESPATSSNDPSLENSPKVDRLVHGSRESIILAGGDSLAKRVATIESILKGTLAKRASLIYIKRLLSRLWSSLTPVQTFSVVVSERAANSCDLWSSITDASNAYSRRRLADFRRLKHGFVTAGEVKNSSVRAGSNASSMANFGIDSSSIEERHPMNANEFILHDRSRPSLMKVDRMQQRQRHQQHYHEMRKRQIDAMNARSTAKLESGLRNAEDDHGHVAEILAASNELHMTPDSTSSTSSTSSNSSSSSSNNNNKGGSNSKRPISVSPIGGMGPSYKQNLLLLNNADESVNSVGKFQHVSSQTKSDCAEIATRIEAPSNYANDRNLRNPLGKVVVERLASVQLVAPANCDTRRGVEDDGEASRRRRPAHRRPQSRRRRYIGSGRAQTSLGRLKRSLNANQIDLDYYLAGARSTELIIERGSSSPTTSSFSSSSASPSSLNDHKLINPSASSLLGATNSMPPQSWPATPTGAPNDDDLKDQTSIIDGDPNGRSNKAAPILQVASGWNRLGAVTDSIQVAQIDGINRVQPDGVHAIRMSSSNWNWNGKRRHDMDDDDSDSDEGSDDYHDQPLAELDAKPVLEVNKLQILNSVDRSNPVRVLNQMAESAEVAAEVSSTRAPANLANSVEPSEMEVQISQASPEGSNHRSTDTRLAVESSDDTQLFTEPMWPLITNSDDEKLDESLMWSAGQYLYMHMRALAASSIYGVEVDVEWSNERSNGTSFDAQDRQTIDASMGSNKANSEFGPGHSHHAYTRDTTPFATIDVIAGQSLQLQCTAHALGRLPEVKWYKLIHSIPTNLRGLIKMVRRIGYDMYWPLTELDLLSEYENPKRISSFVSSQTTTIFDNLDNQTFTVVSNLQLSQYYDKVEPGTIKSGSLPIEGDYNLYACIVDADVRHNFATLGVHFRESPGKISPEISRRLRAKSVLTSETKVSEVSSGRSLINRTPGVETPVDSYASFDLLRENQLKFPLQNHWIPIQSDSLLRSNIEGFPLSPATLSFIILAVFSSLISLVYLTLHSYKTMIQAPTEEENLSDRLIEQTSDHTLDQAGLTSNDSITERALNRIPSSPEPFNNESLHSRCFCQLGFNRDHSNFPRLFEMGFNEDCSCDSVANHLVDYGNNLAQQGKVLVKNKTLYAAHSHGIETHYIYHSLATSEITSGKSINQTNLYGC